VLGFMFGLHNSGQQSSEFRCGGCSLRVWILGILKYGSLLLVNFGVLEVWIVGYMIAPSVGHFVYASWMYVLVGYMSSCN
jgi:hypothetical protein